MSTLQLAPLRKDLLGDFSDPETFRLEITELNERMSVATAQDVIEWADGSFGNGLVLTTSFGIQSAVMLHLASSVNPGIPVIWVDTGYLPEETYRFAEDLTRRLKLNLHVAQSPLSPARMDATLGKLWESEDVDDLNLYDQIRKIEPMKHALEELGARAWLSGLRSEQTEFRRTLSPVGYDGERYKVLPILNWTSKDVHDYLTQHDLPYHPLFDEGYTTVGDAHSSRSLSAADAHERSTRFGGLKEECGLHLPGAFAQTSPVTIAA